MTVFYCFNGQSDKIALCSTLEKAKQWMLNSITEHQEEIYPHALIDPNPWEGWSWWEHNGKYCFGVKEENPAFCEGYIQEMDVL